MEVFKINLHNKHMVIISLDALKADDLNILLKLPNFSKLIKKSAVVKRVKTIYPSLTYPTHTTIVTGNYPKTHGITSNKLLQPFSDKADWHWYRKYIKCTTLYDEAKKNNLTVASIFWPVSAKSSIKYNMPEVFSNKEYISQELSSLLSGSVLYQLRMFKKYNHLKKGFREPELDDFGVSVAKDTLEKYKPNLLLLHLLDVDSHRHEYGTYSPEAINALNRHDDRLGKIIDSLKRANIYDNTDIIILGDHGFQDYEKVVCINNYFKDLGYIKLNSNNKIINWEAYVKSCDGSAQVYLKNPRDNNLKNKIYKEIKNLIKNPCNGIEAIYPNKETVYEKASPDASFIMEAKDGFAISEKVTKDFIVKAKTKTERTVGTHGYSPQKSALDTLLIASGPSFKENIIIDSIGLIDVAPTLAEAFGFSFPKCDGKIVYDLINNRE